MSNVELATGYIALVPSAKGIEGQIAKELAPVALVAEKTGTDAGNRMSGGLLSAVQGVSPKLVAAFGFAAIGVAAFSAARDVDDAYDTIRVGTGATGKALESLEATFRNVVKTVPSDFGSAADAISEINQRLDLTGPALEASATQFLNLSRITKTDLGANIESVTGLFNQFGVAASEQGAKLDLLYRASQQSGVSVADLATNMASAGTVLRGLGFSFEQTAALVATLGKAGVDASEALPALGRAMATAAKEGVPAKEFFESFLASIKNAATDEDAKGIAFEVLGQRAGKFAQLIREGKLSYEDMLRTIMSGKDTINQAADDTADAAESIQKLGNQAKLILADIGAPLFAGLAEGAQDALPVLGALGSLLDHLQFAIGPAVVGLGSFYAASKLGVPAVDAFGLGVQKLGQAMLDRGFDPNGPAVQGLASFANWTGRLTEKLPLIAASAGVAAASFGQIGESAEGSALGIGSLVATGASIGSTFGPQGTAIGAAIGGIAGLGKALFDGGESAEEFRRRIQGLAVEVEKLGTIGSVKAFVDQLKGLDQINFLKGETSGVVAAIKQLRELAEVSPASAQRVVDGLQRMRDEAGKPLFSGRELAGFQAAVDAGSAALERQNRHKADAQVTNQQYAASEGTAKSAVDLTTGSIEQQIGALSKQEDALLATYDATFRAAHANEAARDALWNYAVAAGDANTSQDQLDRTLLTAEESAIHAAAAAGLLAAQNAAAAGAADTQGASTQAQISYLENLTSTLEPDSPLRVFLEQYIERLKNGIPPAVNTEVGATDNASPVLDPIMAKLRWISASVIAGGWNPSGGEYFDPAHNAAGGWVDAGGWSVVGERGPELVRFGSAGRVFSNEDSRALLSGVGGLFGVGAALGAGLDAGLASWASTVPATAAAIITAAEAAARREARSNSPSELFADVGRDLVAGITAGVEDEAPRATASVAQVVADMDASARRAADNAKIGINVGLAPIPDGYVAAPVGVRSSALWTQEMVDAYEASRPLLDRIASAEQKLWFAGEAMAQADLDAWLTGLSDASDDVKQAAADAADAAHKAVGDAKAMLEALQNGTTSTPSATPSGGGSSGGKGDLDQATTFRDMLSTQQQMLAVEQGIQDAVVKGTLSVKVTNPQPPAQVTFNNVFPNVKTVDDAKQVVLTVKEQLAVVGAL